MIYIFLIDGFEEIEAIATVDVLRRAGLDVRTVSLTGSHVVTAAHGVGVVADMLFEEGLPDAELLIIPGGTIAYAEHEGMKRAAHEHYEKGGRVAAICAAPAVLGMLGILKGKRATCYPGYEGYCEGASICAGEAVVVDDRIITGRGPGLTLPFALTIVEIMAGREKRDEIASQLLID